MPPVQANLTTEQVSASHTVTTLTLDISPRLAFTVLAEVAMWCADLGISSVLEGLQ